MEMDIDKGFICAILRDGSLRLAIDAKISEAWLNKPYNEMFLYLKDFSMKYGKVPSIETAEKRFGGAFYMAPPENLIFYIDRIKSRQKYNKIAALSKGIIDKIKNAKGYLEEEKLLPELEAMILKQSSEFVLELSESKVQDYLESAESRYQDYVDRKDPEKMKQLYIPTPWEPLNEQIIGWGGGDFITIIGDSAVGKTWSLLLCMVKAHLAGKDVLLFTQEMTFRQLGVRLDAMLMQKNFKALKQSRLDLVEEQEYQAFLKKLAKDRKEERVPRFIIIQGAADKGAEGIMAASRALQCDIIGIDGAYLFSSDYTWGKMAELTGTLKNGFLLQDVPGVLTNQTAAKGSKTQAAFSPSFRNDSSVMLKQYKDPEKRNLPYMNYQLDKGRDAENPFLIWTTNWDFDAMDFRHRPDLQTGDVIMEYDGTFPGMQGLQP